MNTYWALVRTTPGTTVRVTIQSDNPTNAYALLKALYGAQLYSTAAIPV